MVNYWWILGLHEGRTLLLGPEPSKEEADGKAMSTFDPDKYEVMELPTSNSVTATRMVKRRKLDNENLNNALQKIGHREPELRLREPEEDYSGHL